MASRRDPWYPHLDLELFQIIHLAFVSIKLIVHSAFSHAVFLDRFGQFRSHVGCDDNGIGDFFMLDGAIVVLRTATSQFPSA